LIDSLAEPHGLQGASSFTIKLGRAAHPGTFVENDKPSALTVNQGNFNEKHYLIFQPNWQDEFEK